MKIIKVIDNIICKIEAYTLIIGVLSMSLLLCFNVFARVVMNNSLSYAEEVGQMLIVLVIFAGIGYSIRKGRYINMTSFYDKFPFKIKKKITIFIGIVSGLTMAYLMYLGIQYTITVYESGRVTPALEFPKYIITMIYPIGFGLGAIQFFINTYLNVKYKDEVLMDNELFHKENGGKQS